MKSSADSGRTPSRKTEWITFLVLTLVVLPAIAVAFVGVYGFVVWMEHSINGPPTVGYSATPLQ